MRYCSQCGTRISSDGIFCSKCGKKIEGNDFSIQSPGAKEDNILKTFIGPNAEYYLPRWERMERENSYISWNWAAFFLSTLWLLYRKMYLYALLYTLAGIVLSSLILPGLVLWIAMGMFGNYLYKRHTEERVAAIRSAYPDMENQLSILANRGGTTWVPVIIVVGLFGFFFIAALLLGMFSYLMYI